ncbi:MAG: hypothetical protein ACYDCG_05545 [Candidatus Acidiferrales bacterium]
MRSSFGKVAAFLHDAQGRINGFVLEGGEEVRSSVAQLDRIAAIVTRGSRIEISGDLQSGNEKEIVLHAARLTNLDSKQTLALPAPVCLGKPGMLSDATPTTTASLALHSIDEKKKSPGGVSQAQRNPAPFDRLLEAVAREARQSPFALNDYSQEQPPHAPRATRSDSAAEIERAYDALHRIQAILAYLHIMKLQVHGMSQMHEEARHTYEQALSRHAAQDFEGAREIATASVCLSRVVEGIISRTLRSDTTYPSLVPPPPAHTTVSEGTSRVQSALRAVEALLSRVHWLLENGTLPVDDRTQVRRITAWSDAFYQQARRVHERGSDDEAGGFLQAALDAAHSAEHICRNWYVAQAADPQHHMIPDDPSTHR